MKVLRTLLSWIFSGYTQKILHFDAKNAFIFHTFIYMYISLKLLYNHRQGVSEAARHLFGTEC